VFDKYTRVYLEESAFPLWKTFKYSERTLIQLYISFGR